MKKEIKPLVLIIGFPGTGKTRLSHKIKGDLESYNRFGTCDVRRILGKEDYYPQDTDEIVAYIYNNSRRLIKEGKGVIIESAYNTFRRRKEVYELANELKIPVLVIECVCEERIAKERMWGRPRKDGLHRAPTKAEVYDRYKKTWEDVLKDIKSKKNKHISIIRYYSDENKVQDIRVNKEIEHFAKKIKKIMTK